MAERRPHRVPNVLWVLFGFDGRIGREVFLLGVLLLLTAGVVVSPLVAGIMQGSEDTSVLMLFAAFGTVSLWAQLALGVKRAHDLGYPGVAAVVMVLPFVNFVAFIVFSLLPGERAANRFGPHADTRG